MPSYSARRRLIYTRACAGRLGVARCTVVAHRRGHLAYGAVGRHHPHVLSTHLPCQTVRDACCAAHSMHRLEDGIERSDWVSNIQSSSSTDKLACVATGAHYQQSQDSNTLLTASSTESTQWVITADCQLLFTAPTLVVRCECCRLQSLSSVRRTVSI